MNGQTNTTGACCTTPASRRYFAIAFIAALLSLSGISLYWHPLSGAAVPLAIGAACLENWRRNRTYHCGITGPIFLLAGAALLFAGMGLIHVRSAAVWVPAGVGTVAAFLLEWRFASRPARSAK